MIITVEGLKAPCFRCMLLNFKILCNFGGKYRNKNNCLYKTPVNLQ